MRLPVLASLTLVANLVQAQTGASIEVTGHRGQSRTVTAAELSAMPRRDVTASAHHVSGRFDGVSMADVLRLVGAPQGDSLRGPALATYVIVEGADGYRALFAIAEFDAGFTDRVSVIADRKDGAELAAKDGPFQLIVPGEKRPGRWVRQVRRIRVVQVPTRP